jgi:hypothetical protein
VEDVGGRTAASATEQTKALRNIVPRKPHPQIGLLGVGEVAPKGTLY